MVGQRRVGRPTTVPKEREKATLGIRASADLKRRLAGAAQTNGRSLSQEAELRLENSFRDQDATLSALELSFGSELAAILLILGKRIVLLSSIENYLTGTKHENVSAWLYDPYVFDQSLKMINAIIEGFRPEGDPDFYTQPGALQKLELADLSRKTAQNTGEEGAQNELYLVAFSHPPGHPELRGRNKFYEMVREMLGATIIERVAKAVPEERQP